MLIKTIPVGQLEENCYVVTNEATLESVVIDPGDEANTILDYLESNKLKCVAIMLTHGHFDHVGAVDAVAEETGATVYMNELDDAKRHQNNHSSYTLRDGGIYYSDGDVIDAAGLSFHIIATPGHTPGGVTIQVEDCLFTGDTLFNLCIGGLFEGSAEQMFATLNKIKELPNDVKFYPGHEYTIHGIGFAQYFNPNSQLLKQYVEEAMGKIKQGKPVAPVTLGLEKHCNPYLQAVTPASLNKLCSM